MKPTVVHSKVALVYDRVNKWGGAERVLLALHELFPDAPLYTSVYDPKSAPWAKVFPKVIPSFLQNFPLAKSNHEFLPLFMPLAFGSFDFSEYDLVISVTSEAAKGIKTSGKTKHICYCLTPTRYLWSGYDEYFKNPIFKAVAYPAVYTLRIWDKWVAKKPDIIIAISKEVQKRIKKYYGRGSAVIFPPVSAAKGIKTPGVSTDIHFRSVYYLLVSRLDYGYKKVDLAIKSFNKLGIPLVIVGKGREERKLKKIAKENIKFAGEVSERSLSAYYNGAKALIMPQEEDFGIVAVEAQAHGIPVIAYKKGGVLDTVIPGKTGLFFKKQTLENLTQAVKEFEKKKFNTNVIKANAKRFSQKEFDRKFLDLIKKVLH